MTTEESLMKKIECIVFIGMPGSGKTTIARLLSKEIKWPWLDTDHLLEAWFGLPLEEIKQRLGNEQFLKAEEEIVLMLDVNRFIIATGGSVIYSDVAMKKLKEIGIVVYLEADFKTIKKRIEMYPNRGLIISPSQDLKHLYLERTPLYEKYADFKISTDQTLSLCVSEIKTRLKTYTKSNI